MHGIPRSEVFGGRVYGRRFFERTGGLTPEDGRVDPGYVFRSCGGFGVVPHWVVPHMIYLIAQSDAPVYDIFIVKIKHQKENEMADVLDLKTLINFKKDSISRQMLSDKPEMRVALMCLEAGQELQPHKAPLRLMMYCVQGKGVFIVGDEEIEADAMTAILCDPMVPHGFKASKGERLVVMAVVTPQSD